MILAEKTFIVRSPMNHLIRHGFQAFNGGVKPGLKIIDAYDAAHVWR
jgi:hypothetical protein